MHFRFLIAAVALFFATAMAAHAATDEYKVTVLNLPLVTDASEYVTKNLKPELKNALQNSNLVLFAEGSHYDVDGYNYCYVSLGATGSVPSDRNPRNPGYSVWSGNKEVKAKDWSFSGCIVNRFVDAVKRLNKLTVEELLKNSERTVSIGGTRLPLAADNKTVSINYSSSSLSDAARAAISEDIHQYNFGEFFDYRQTSVFVDVLTLKFDDGVTLCIGNAGLVARPPKGRDARWPGYTITARTLQDGNDSDQCLTIAGRAAVKGLLDRPWTTAGIFQDFAPTREDGLLLPDFNVVATKHKVFLAQQKAAEKAAEKAEARANKVSVRSTQRNHTSCRNQCTNGSCLRTFPDGKTERWQAPRTFDAMSGDWKWDTSSCGG